MEGGPQQNRSAISLRQSRSDTPSHFSRRGDDVGKKQRAITHRKSSEKLVKMIENEVPKANGDYEQVGARTD